MLPTLIAVDPIIAAMKQGCLPFSGLRVAILPVFHELLETLHSHTLQLTAAQSTAHLFGGARIRINIDFGLCGHDGPQALAPAAYTFSMSRTVLVLHIDARDIDSNPSFATHAWADLKTFQVLIWCESLAIHHWEREQRPSEAPTLRFTVCPRRKGDLKRWHWIYCWAGFASISSYAPVRLFQSPPGSQDTMPINLRPYPIYFVGSSRVSTRAMDTNKTGDDLSPFSVVDTTPPNEVHILILAVSQGFDLLGVRNLKHSSQAAKRIARTRLCFQTIRVTVMLLDRLHPSNILRAPRSS